MGELSDGDRSVLPAMRRVALVATFVLLAGFLALWGFPSRAPDVWAWTVKPELTAIFMGAWYGAGAYFFLQVYRERKWHEVSIGVLSAAAFALLMLVKALGYYDKFNHSASSQLATLDFYAWLIVFSVSPFLVGWLWWRNQRVDDGVPAENDLLVPARLRTAARVLAIVTLLIAATLMVAPALAVDNWGWTVTSLTVRVLACFVMQMGVALLLLSWEPRWSSWRILVQTSLVLVALLLLGALRARHGFDAGHPMTWIYLATLAGAGGGAMALYRSGERHSRAGRPTTASAGSGRPGPAVRWSFEPKRPLRPKQASG